MSHSALRRSLLSLPLLCAAFEPARAQSKWPSRPITIFVPSAAGGAADYVGRTWAAYLSSALSGSPVTVENKAGAGGIVGTLAARSAPPDGHAFLISTNSTHAANLSLYAKPGYDPEKDFEPVGLFGKFATVLMVRSDGPFKTVPDLIDFARRKPDALTFGYYSSSSQVPAELLKSRAGIRVVGTSYKNITQIITDLIGGQIDFAFLDMLSAAPGLKNDRLRAIAVSSPKPSAALPQVPTVAQTLPGYEVEGWIGLHAPAGTPRPIIERVDGIIQKALTDDEVRKGLEGRGMVVSAMDSRAMRSFVAEDVKRWAQWVSIAGIVPQ